MFMIWPLDPDALSKKEETKKVIDWLGLKSSAHPY